MQFIDVRTLSGVMRPEKMHQVPWVLQGREVDERLVMVFSAHLNCAGTKDSRITKNK